MSKKTEPCEIDGCDAIAKGGFGLCWKHYARLRRKGDPLKTERWMGDADPVLFHVRYTSAHQRVAKARGSAQEHRCMGCYTWAQDWAYVHKSGYSMNPDDYIPLCRRCHRVFDGHTGPRSIGWGAML